MYDSLLCLNFRASNYHIKWCMNMSSVLISAIITDSHTDRQIITVSMTVSVGNSNVVPRRFNFKRDAFILIKLIKNIIDSTGI